MNTPVVAKKSWFTSKIVLGSGLVTLIDVAQYFAAPEHTPVLTVSSIATVVVAIGMIVARVWFTNQPITEAARATTPKVVE